MAHPLYVVFLWHMHQPHYAHPATGELVMPWVRLHAAKDYLRMAELLAAHPRMRMSINFVPSLLEQLDAYAAEQSEDVLMRLARTATWGEADRRVALNLCFSAHEAHMIRPHRRYAQLAARRDAHPGRTDAFSQADYWDMLAWCNLVWIDPTWQRNDPRIRRLLARGQGFTPDDIETIHTVQRDIIRRTLPRYAELQQAGQLELSVSPYYHPILPLLVDNEATWEPQGGQVAPSYPIQAPEDAAAQLAMAQAYGQRLWDGAVPGLWPSEGAVSNAVLALAWRAGFRWTASDEAVLGQSLGRPFERDGHGFITRPRDLYRPYRVLLDGELGPDVLFRDHDLSDRIGFLYHGFPPRQAADDLYFRLLGIRERLDDTRNAYVVPIILDGENAWESYEEQGDPFFHALYAQLTSQLGVIEPVTIADYLQRGPAHGTLAGIATGSWIGGDLSTWIGDWEHARAWDLLATARADLVRWQERTPDADPVARTAAWRSLYNAEGSDWFWWYSHRNRSAQDALFDELFRAHLAQTYLLRGAPVPAAFGQPVGGDTTPPTTRQSTGFITPELAAAPRPGPEWAHAAVVQASASTGTMQRAGVKLRYLRVGHDTHALYLRCEFDSRQAAAGLRAYLSIAGTPHANQHLRLSPLPTVPEGLAWEIMVAPGAHFAYLYQATGNEQWQPVGEIPCVRSDMVLEMRVELAPLGLALGDSLGIVVATEREGYLAEMLPVNGLFTITLTDFTAAG